MNKKENPKSKYISFRVPEDTKIAFKKVADKLGVKVSDLLLEFVEAKILDEGIVKIKFYIGHPGGVTQSNFYKSRLGDVLAIFQQYIVKGQFA